MNKLSIEIPDVYTKPDDVCYGMINVYVQEGEKLDLTSSKAQHLEKYVPVLRAICYHSAEMFKLLRMIAEDEKNLFRHNGLRIKAVQLVNKIEESVRGYQL